MTGRERIHAAIDGKPTGEIPCAPLMIRLPAARNGANLKDYLLDARVFADCQLRTAEEFDLDAIMMASEPTRVVHTLGGEVSFPDDNVPHVERPLIESVAGLDGLALPDLGDRGTRMGDLLTAVELTVKGARGRRSVFGWADAPFAEACNMLTVEKTLYAMYDDQRFVRRLLEFNTKLVVAYLDAQLALGVDAVAIGDAAASLLSPELYRSFAYPYEVEVIEFLHGRGIPVKMHMCGNNTAKLETIAATGVDILNVDQQTDIVRAREIAPDLCLKGNVDPVHIMKDGSPDSIREKGAELIRTIGPRKFILSAGCDLPPDTPSENLAALVACARNGVA